MEEVELHMEEEFLLTMELLQEDMEHLQADMELQVLDMELPVLDMTHLAQDMIVPAQDMTVQALDLDLTPALDTQLLSLDIARDQQIFCQKNRKISPMVLFMPTPQNQPWRDHYYPIYYLFNRHQIILLLCLINYSLIN